MARPGAEAVTRMGRRSLRRPATRDAASLAASYAECVRRLLLALAVALVAVGPARASGTATVISVVSVTTLVKTHDVPPKGASPGDTTTTADKLLNAVAQFGKKKGAVVGSDRATIKIVSKTEETIDGVATFPGGTLVIRGRLASGPNNTVVAPVPSGTGRFAGLHGTLVIASIGKSAELALNVYRLVGPPAA
jgi:hypothetical protein